MALQERVVIITGHYGAGKTNLAVNLALRRAEAGEPVVLIDLDVVNPYFRSHDFEAFLAGRGIRVVAPRYAGSNVDIPSITGDMGAAMLQRGHAVIVDVGGDDAGAFALGRYARDLEREDFGLYYVINARRPMVADPEDAARVLRDIEAACHLKACGLINCTSLAGETTAAVIEESFGYAEAIERLTGLPVAATAVLEGAPVRREKIKGDIIPIARYVMPEWENTG